MAQTRSEAYIQRCSEESLSKIFGKVTVKTPLNLTFNKNFTRKKYFQWCSPKKFFRLCGAPASNYP